MLLPKSTARERLRRAVELKKLYDEFDEPAVRTAKELVAENGPLSKGTFLFRRVVLLAVKVNSLAPVCALPS